MSTQNTETLGDTGLFGSLIKGASSLIIKSGQDPKTAVVSAVKEPSIFDNLLKGTIEATGLGTIDRFLGAGVGAAGDWAKANPDMVGLLAASAAGAALGQGGVYGAGGGMALAGGAAAKQIQERRMEEAKITAAEKLAGIKFEKEGKPKDKRELAYGDLAKYSAVVQSVKGFDKNIAPMMQTEKGIDDIKKAYLRVGSPSNPDQAKFRTTMKRSIESLLRDVSGAAIGTKEYQEYAKQYEPYPNDSPEVVREKLETLYELASSKLQGTREVYNTGDTELYQPKYAGRLGAIGDVFMANAKSNDKNILPKQSNTAYAKMKTLANNTIALLAKNGATQEEIDIVKKEYGL